MSKIGLYGRVALEKQYCNDCKSLAFVVDGILKCCDKKVGSKSISSVKRETEALNQRLPTHKKADILNMQRHKCYLCGLDLSQRWWYIKKTRPRIVRIEYDHFIPKSFCPNNDIENIYAMCNLCNRYKGSKMFDSRDAAVEYVMSIRKNNNTLEVYSDIELQASQRMPKL